MEMGAHGGVRRLVRIMAACASSCRLHDLEREGTSRLPKTSRTAAVQFERVPFTVRCQSCGEVYPLDYRDEATWSCPACGKRDYRLNTGREFSIASITVERYAPGEAAAPRASRAPRPLTPARDLAVSGRRPVGSNR